MNLFSDPTMNAAFRNIDRQRRVFKGDIYFVKKGSSHGSEQEAGRPAIIVSNNDCNKHADCVEIVYLTTAKKAKLPTHVEIVARQPSTALCEQIYTVSKDRLEKYVRTLSLAEQRKIDRAMIISLGIEVENL